MLEKFDNYHNNKIDSLLLRIILKEKKVHFPLKLYESSILEDSLAEFKFSKYRIDILSEVLKWASSRKCFVYLFWMFLSLKFKHMTNFFIIGYCRKQLR